jgi:hypothetical protein
MSITLAKALKIKSKLIGEIKELESMIYNKNSFIINQNNSIDNHISKYDVTKMLSELNSKIEKLVNIKIAINDANSEIIHQIFTISEYKSQLKFISGLDIKEGFTRRGYMETEASEYYSQIDDNMRNTMKKELQTKIDNIQDELDNYNHSTKLYVDVADFV